MCSRPAAQAEVLIYLITALKSSLGKGCNLGNNVMRVVLDGMNSKFWSKWFGWQECYLVDLWYTQVLLWELKHHKWWLLTADSWVALGKCSQLNNAASPKLTPSCWVCSHSDWSKHGEEYPAPFVSVWDTCDGLFQLPSPLWNCLRQLSQDCSSASPLLPQRS